MGHNNPDVPVSGLGIFLQVPEQEGVADHHPVLTHEPPLCSLTLKSFVMEVEVQLSW